MIHVHPFPARMAPEIALERLESLSPEAIVLDPMCGSGMVLSQSARMGIHSIGCDLDPLARLISRVGSTRVKETAVWDFFDELMTYCKQNNNSVAKLDWIDNDQETKNFVKFWFGPDQEKQLRRIAKFLSQANPGFRSGPKNVISIALSRLIITKEPKASFARDTAHSRPHRTISENNFDIYKQMENSVKHVIKALDSTTIKANAKTYIADARNLSRIPNASVDRIITSPPYLNAIDYMRGHKFSLIWFGFNLATLRSIRSNTIGSEASFRFNEHIEFEELLSALELFNLQKKTRSLLNRYYSDLKNQLLESKRVLKPGKLALFVIGNSSIKGNYIKNNEVLKFAARKVGLKIKDEKIRAIPDGRRYLPVTLAKSNALSGRMRTEHIIEFSS